MAWKTPKTNWAVRYDEDGAYAGDYFGAEDFSRIADNIAALQEMAAGLYRLPEPGALPQITAASFAYADDLNALEDALRGLTEDAFRPAGTQPFVTWRGNEPGPGPEDLNRLESLCAALHGSFTQQAAARARLAMTLGGVQF